MKTIVMDFYSKYASGVCIEINKYANSNGYEILSVSICELHGSIQAIAVFRAVA
mgnify:FL=1